MAGAFLEMVQSRGTVEPDEDVLEDAVAFAGVARYPARVKCALLGWMAWKDAVAQAGGSHHPPGCRVNTSRDNVRPLASDRATTGVGHE